MHHAAITNRPLKRMSAFDALQTLKTGARRAAIRYQMRDESDDRNIGSSRLRIAALLLSASLGCCSDDTARNVVTDRGPFYQTEVAFDQAHMNAVIQTVRSFSEEHRMDFLLAHETIGPGEFNASANGYSLNLRAMHV